MRIKNVVALKEIVSDLNDGKLYAPIINLSNSPINVYDMGNIYT